MTKALIIGAGIAGPVAAMALQKAGISSVVYEAYPTEADGIGAFLTVAANGLDALAAIDADQLVISHSFVARSVQLVNSSGKVLGEITPNAGSAAHSGSHTLTRATLYRTLRDEATKRDITIEHGKRLTALSPGPVQADHIVALFEDGTSATGDLLIGADGVHSTVRRTIDPGAPSPRHTGLNTICGYTRDVPEHLTSPNRYRMISGKHAFLGYTTAPDGETWWFANAPGQEMSNPHEATPDEWKQRLIALFRKDNTPAADIIRATGNNIVASNAYDIPTTPTWHRNNLIIIGDAAHATSPNAAQGASMAAEDAIILAQCLRDLPDVDMAFTVYEHLRRERVERVVAASARMGARKTVGPIRRFFRDRARSRAVQRRSPGDSVNWLQGHHIDWDTTIQADTNPLADASAGE
jgi:2-polyprenyl-6-methoxyphenol hydroxylase-like FAD-dependent oxidoreductase